MEIEAEAGVAAGAMGATGATRATGDRDFAKHSVIRRGTLEKILADVLFGECGLPLIKMN